MRYVAVFHLCAVKTKDVVVAGSCSWLANSVVLNRNLHNLLIAHGGLLMAFSWRQRMAIKDDKKTQQSFKVINIQLNCCDSYWKSAPKIGIPWIFCLPLICRFCDYCFYVN